MSNYPAVGNTARLSCTFTNSSGVAADPTTVTVQYKPPTGAVTTATPIRDSVGVYHYDTQLNEPGTWNYRFIGTGVVTARSGDMSLYVDPPQF